MATERITLPFILGPSYGGPSIGYDDGHFVLYSWTDAPVEIDILVRHGDWETFLQLCRQHFVDTKGAS